MLGHFRVLLIDLGNLWLSILLYHTSQILKVAIILDCWRQNILQAEEKSRFFSFFVKGTLPLQIQLTA